MTHDDGATSQSATLIHQTRLLHQALLYDGTDEFVEGTAPFVEEGLARAEPVLVALPGAGLGPLADALGPAAATVRFVDMAEAGRNPGRIIPWLLHAFMAEHQDRPVRIIGEPIWAGRSAREYPACVQHEALINLRFGDRPARILCPYDVRRLAPAALRDAERTHPELVSAGKSRPSPAFAPQDTVDTFNLPLDPAPADVDWLAFDLAGLATVRDVVADRASRCGLSDRRVIDLQLAANELATNVVRHGGGAGQLGVWAEPGVIICEVRDRGRATRTLPGRLPPEPDSVAGRGLVLVNYLTDLVRFHTGPLGTAVRLHLYI